MLRKIPIYVVAALVGVCLTVLACPMGSSSQSPNPIIPPDTELCGPMCEHLGRDGGLGCQEGDSVYDSDVPGPVDIPNVSCQDWCTKAQTRGYFVNPRCVMQVSSCSDIESARQKTCVN